jgi:hypothetical protein
MAFTERRSRMHSTRTSYFWEPGFKTRRQAIVTEDFYNFPQSLVAKPGVVT